jgi:hypothetical protein
MKKFIMFYLLFILLTTPTVLAVSSVSLQATISESVEVVFKIASIEANLYNEIKTQGIFNASTIPKAIEGYFKQKELANAWVVYDPFQNIFDEDANSVQVKFVLAGSDVVSYALNKTEMARTFWVRTDWRRFEVSLTQNFTLDFDEHFGAPLSEWQLSENVFEKKSVQDDMELLFRFVLPENAYGIQTEDDIIIFKVALAFEDSLLNSPFLILGAVIAVNIIVLVYRRVRK